MGLNFAMKIISLSIFLTGISVNAQFAYPEVKIPDPISELNAKEQPEYLILDGKKVKEFLKTEKSDSGTETELKRYAEDGSLIFSRWTVEVAHNSTFVPMPGLGSSNQDDTAEYTTTFSDGRITGFQTLSSKSSSNKAQILYDSDGNIYQIKERYKSSEYLYERGKIIRQTNEFRGSLESINFQYDVSGHPTSTIMEFTSPGEHPKSGTGTFTYDKAGNILVSDIQSPMTSIRKEYTYQNNRLSSFTLFSDQHKKETVTYYYTPTGLLKQMIQTFYRPDTGAESVIRSTEYLYNDGLLSEKRKTEKSGKSAVLYSDVFVYNAQKQLIQITELFGKSVKKKTDITYTKDTITLTGNNSSTAYTLYQ